MARQLEHVFPRQTFIDEILLCRCLTPTQEGSLLWALASSSWKTAVPSRTCAIQNISAKLAWQMHRCVHGVMDSTHVECSQPHQGLELIVPGKLASSMV